MTRWLQVIERESGEVMQTFAPSPVYGLNATSLSSIIGPQYDVAWLVQS